MTPLLDDEASILWIKTLKTRLIWDPHIYNIIRKYNIYIYTHIYYSYIVIYIYMS